MTTYFCNVFVPSMLDSSHPHVYEFHPISRDEVLMHLDAGFTCAIGHPATAAVLSTLLDREILASRLNVRLEDNDTVIVAQIVVPRLEEGQILSREEVEKLPFVFWMIHRSF